MKFGIQEELLLSFLDTKFLWLPVHNGGITSNKSKHLIKLFCRKVWHTHTYRHTEIHTHIHTDMHTYIHTYIHTHTHTHTYTHTYTHIHTDIHTHIHTCAKSSFNWQCLHNKLISSLIWSTNLFQVGLSSNFINISDNLYQTLNVISTIWDR